MYANCTERKPAEPQAVTIGTEAVCVGDEELDRLLAALAALDVPAAASLRDEIVALRLAGGPVQLRPTEAELEALRVAIGSE